MLRMLTLLSLTLPLAAQEQGEILMKKSDCFSCHAVNRKVVGPSYADVAKKYKGAGPAKIKELVQKVKNGGSGVWGAVPMSAHPQLSEADIEIMVRWVLAQKGTAASAPVPQPQPAAQAKPSSEPVKPEAAAKPATVEKAEAKAKPRRHSHASRPGHGAAALSFDSEEGVRQAMRAQDCFGCHSGLNALGMAEEFPWPSFVKIQSRYGANGPVQALVRKIRMGEGRLNWGEVPHPTYSHLPEEGVAKMVAMILDGTWSSKGEAQAKRPEDMGAEEWMKTSDCFSCHAVNRKVVGPSYQEVAKRYAGATDAQVKALVRKVKEGGSGVWGNVPMTAHPTASDAVLEKAVRWVLQQK